MAILPIKMNITDGQSNAAKLMAREGARHLYLLDYSNQVESFAKTLKTDFPDTQVGSKLILNQTDPRSCILHPGGEADYQVTCVVADAASAKAISALVDRVISEEGQLDFFFANAGVTMLPQFRTGSVESQIQGSLRRLTDISEEEFTEVMRINALRWVNNLSTHLCVSTRTSVLTVQRVSRYQVCSGGYG